jgi:hypothetical protein
MMASSKLYPLFGISFTMMLTFKELWNVSVVHLWQKSRALQLILRKVFLPKHVIESVTPELAKFGEEIISKRVFDWVTDAERNVPYVRGGGRDAFGRKTSELVVSEGWKNLQNFGIENG